MSRLAGGLAPQPAGKPGGAAEQLAKQWGYPLTVCVQWKSGGGVQNGGPVGLHVGGHHDLDYLGNGRDRQCDACAA
eukprot:14845385-Alexandrium_andersonii.AAC.1